jgi:hypothetical protein
VTTCKIVIKRITKPNGVFSGKTRHNIISSFRVEEKAKQETSRSGGGGGEVERISPKRYEFAELHGVAIQKVVVVLVTAMITSNPTVDHLVYCQGL